MVQSIQASDTGATKIWDIHGAQQFVETERARVKMYSCLVVEITTGKSVLTPQYFLTETMTY